MKYLLIILLLTGSCYGQGITHQVTVVNGVYQKYYTTGAFVEVTAKYCTEEKYNYNAKGELTISCYWCPITSKFRSIADGLEYLNSTGSNSWRMQFVSMKFDDKEIPVIKCNGKWQINYKL